MISRLFATALLAGACGQVAGKPGVDGGGGDAAEDGRPTDTAVPVAYKGTLAQTPPVTFGGNPFCVYTITLKQLQLNLDILAAGQVTAGRFQALGVEANDPVACPNGVIPPTIANYTLQSAVPSGATTRLTFLGASENFPKASLVATLSRSGTGYSAQLTVHRTDQMAPLDWTVNVTLALSPQ